MAETLNARRHAKFHLPAPGRSKNRKAIFWVGPALAVCAATLMTPAQAAEPTMRAFASAHCQSLTDACTGPITKALDAAAASGRIPAKCAAGRPPKPPMALDIALWWVGHHELDNKPLSEAVVATAERLWPCSRVQ